jgi:hypothetical protein
MSVKGLNKKVPEQQAVFFAALQQSPFGYGSF